MSMVPPNAYITPASPVVVEQISRVNDKADHLDALTLEVVQDMTQLSFTAADLDPRMTFTDEDLNSLLNQLGDLPEFDMDTDWLSGLSLNGGDAAFTFNPEIYQYIRQMLPEFNLPPLGALTPEPTAPSDPGEPEEIPPPVKPDTVQYTAPDTDVDAEIPVYSDYTSEIPFPTLRPIDLPTPPVINTDDIIFEGVRPVFDAVPPDPEDFAFANSDYQTYIIDQTKAKVLEIFNGQTGLPPAIEDAIFERAREREVEAGEREVDQARNEWAARGWKQPPGMLNAATNRARKQASDKVSALNRENFIETKKLQLDMLKTALSTAMAMEDIWARLFMSAEDRRQQASKMKVDIALQVFNAFVSKFQAESSLFAVDATVFNQKFQAAMAKLSLYSEELRAKQIIGELNEQDVRIFAQRVGALQTNAEIYRAKVEGYKALFDAIQSKVDVYKAQLESNQIILQGYETDTRAFSARLQAAAQRDERFKTRAEIYSTNMGAWKMRFDLLVAQQNQSFKAAELTRDTFVANTDRIRGYISAEEGRVGALRDKYSALASTISSRAEAERTKYQLMLSIAQAKISQMEAAWQILLKNGEINIQAGLTAEGLVLRAHETAATTLAQLAAGYTSAANVNASISDSSSSSIGYNFSGEIDVN